MKDGVTDALNTTKNGQHLLTNISSCKGYVETNQFLQPFEMLVIFAWCQNAFALKEIWSGTASRRSP